MLRALIVALLAANLLFFGFTRGWLDGLFGLRSHGDREPERIAHQVRPDSIVLLAASAPASAAAGATTTCLEAGPFAGADAAAVEAALRAALPDGSWSESTIAGAGSGAATRTYRLSTSDAAVAARAAGLRLDASGRGFSPCAKP